MTDKLLTPDSVKERLGVSKTTLYNWAREKINLQPRKIGKQYRYKESDVNRFINGGGK